MQLFLNLNIVSRPSKSGVFLLTMSQSREVSRKQKIYSDSLSFYFLGLVFILYIKLSCKVRSSLARHLDPKSFIQKAYHWIYLI